MKPSSEAVLILHHALPATPGSPSAESDAGVMAEVVVVAAALDRLGVPHRTVAIATLGDLTAHLQTSQEKTVFNLVENLLPQTADAALVPSVCHAFGKAVTGNDTACQTLCLDKWRTKAVLATAGLPVPAGVLVAPGSHPPARGLPRGALIVKPLFADASEGIDARSVVKRAGPGLARAVARVHRQFGHPALIEQFFGTRELNVSVLERDGQPVVLPAAEIEFRGFGTRLPHIVDYKAKWQADSFEFQNTVRMIPAPLTSRKARQVADMARTAWKVAGCRGYARVDFRMTAAGELAILEINPNPDISPDAGFAAALKAAGISVDDFIQGQCRTARTYAAPPSPVRRRSQRARTARRALSDATIQWTRPEDRDAIIALARETGFFLEAELTVATEVLDDSLKAGESGHYQSYTLLADGKPAGWVCFGPTPCTLGTYDIYWIAVSPRCQGRGFGRALLDHAEALIRRARGRVVLLETSGRSLYQGTRGFYLAAGYDEVARVPEFYMPGDDRVIYAKYLHARA